MTITPGRYRHYKGGVYDVIGVGRHTETEEEFVVYSHDGQIWLRPATMFFENVEFNGKLVPRFIYEASL